MTRSSKWPYRLRVVGPHPDQRGGYYLVLARSTPFGGASGLIFSVDRLVGRYSREGMPVEYAAYLGKDELVVRFPASFDFELIARGVCELEPVDPSGFADPLGPESRSDGEEDSPTPEKGYL